MIDSLLQTANNMSRLTHQSKELPSAKPKYIPIKAKQGASKRKSRKRVRFLEQRNRIIVKEPEINIWACWYHPGEYRMFQYGARQTLNALVKGGCDPSSLDPSEHCLRGLEKHQLPAEVRAIYRQQNQQFKRFIIGEHYRLRKAGVNDPESLKAISTLYTAPAKSYAMRLAFRTD